MSKQNQDLTGYPSIDKPWLKYYSEETINAPMPGCTVYEYLRDCNQDHLQKTALNYYGRKITYGELLANIDQAAAAFSSNGIKKGDIVIIAAVTIPETIYTFYGLNKIGAIANMVDPRTSFEGIRNYIEEVKAKYIFTLGVAYPKIEKAIEGKDIKQVIVLSPADSLQGITKVLYKVTNKDTNAYKPNCILWKDLMETGIGKTVETDSYQKDSCCVIVHTGGTTGNPKGVMLSNENLNASAYQCLLTDLDFQTNHNWLNIMPPFIAYGIGNGLHLPLIVGMEIVLIPAFKAEKFADYLRKYHPNHIVGVPSHYGNIIEHPKMKNEDMSYILTPIVGGDTMDENLEKKTNVFLNKHKCPFNVYKGYGMTEVSAAVSVCSSNECNRIGSVGIPFSHTIISIFDTETGNELKYGEQGEVCITGPNTMLGYYDNPTATSDIIRKHEDGRMWVHSGDIGYMTEDGFLYILGRIKRMIVRHDGFKVFPALIEATLSSHPAVEQCCIVGISDKNYSQGKLPQAHIVLKAKNNKTKEQVEVELRELCLRELPEYAQPVEYCFREDIPLTPIGKVDYRALEKDKNK